MLKSWKRSFLNSWRPFRSGNILKITHLIKLQRRSGLKPRLWMACQRWLNMKLNHHAGIISCEKKSAAKNKKYFFTRTTDKSFELQGLRRTKTNHWGSVARYASSLACTVTSSQSRKFFLAIFSLLPSFAVASNLLLNLLATGVI